MAKFAVGEYIGWLGYPSGQEPVVLLIRSVNETGQTYTVQIITDVWQPSNVGKTQTLPMGTTDSWMEAISYGTPASTSSTPVSPQPPPLIRLLFGILPTFPWIGPPLPSGLNIVWPWRKVA